ncbi:V-type H+-transporting ATPase subunit C [Nematocida sp. AWRm77]|nr:V-type H+-transporting ATPase subunit C [Nematocida sp. AWRm77]
MHILVSLPLDEPVDASMLLENTRKGLGSSGKDCDAFFFPEMNSESMNAMFDAEERVASLEMLVQDALHKYLPIYIRAHADKASGIDVHILGKTFDHYLKSFKWDGARYPLGIKLGDLLSIMEQEVSFIVDAFIEKNKQRTEELKKQKPEKKKAESIRTIDINPIAYGEDAKIENSFLKMYYIGVKEKFREKDLQVLTETEGIFIESKTLVAKCFDGEVYSVLGRIDTEERVVKELESKGYCVRKEMSSAEEYRKTCGEEKERAVRLGRAEEALQKVVDGNIERLYVLFIHINYLGLYIESILRFGLPSLFCFFVLRGRSQHKLMDKWEKVSKTWKHSKRVVPVNTLFAHSREHMYDFVYRTIEEFQESVEKAKSDL